MDYSKETACVQKLSQKHPTGNPDQKRMVHPNQKNMVEALLKRLEKRAERNRKNLLIFGSGSPVFCSYGCLGASNWISENLS